MGYGLIGVKNQLEGSGMQALQQVAGEQERDKALKQQMDQADKAMKMNAVASGAGMGMMAGMQAGSVGGPMGMAIGAAVGFLAAEIF